jgi:hypothetical protein
MVIVSIARLLGRLLLGPIERFFERATTDPEALAKKRKYEALARSVKESMPAEEWERLTQWAQRDKGALLPDWEIAEWYDHHAWGSKIARP